MVGFFGQMILGVIWGIAVLAILDPLAVWRRDEPKTKDEQWRNGLFGGRMGARPFVVVAAGVVVVTAGVAHVTGGVLSSLGGVVAFGIGAAIGGIVRRDPLHLVYRTVIGAVREINAKARSPAADTRSSPRRRGLLEAASATDVRVSKAIKRNKAKTAARAAAVKAPVPTVVVVKPRDERAQLRARRREIIAQLKGRAAALATMAPAAASLKPLVVEAAMSVPAPQASVPDKPGRDLWHTEAAAQREIWRKAGEAQRLQWREDAQAMQKFWQRPEDAPPSVGKPSGE